MRERRACHLQASRQTRSKGGLLMVIDCLFSLVAFFSLVACKYAAMRHQPSTILLLLSKLHQSDFTSIHSKRVSILPRLQHSVMATSKPAVARPANNNDMSTPRTLPAMSPPPRSQLTRTDSVTGRTLKTCTSCAGKGCTG